MIDPLKYLGRNFPQPFTCWDFVCLIYQESFGIELDRNGINAATDLRGADKAASDEFAKPVWLPCRGPEENALILLGKGRLRYHVGVQVSPSLTLHLMDKGQVLIQHTPALIRQFQTCQFFRHANLH